jgi:CDP-glycerol glycerophosphotransferase
MSDKSDREELIALIHRNRIAVWTRDFEAYQACFVHAPYTARWNASPLAGIFVREGWDEIARRTRLTLADPAFGNPAYAYDTKVENLQLQIGGDMAWATYRQRYPGIPDHHAGPGASYEMRVFERHDGEWRIAFLGFLDADDVFTPHALQRLVGVLDQSGSDFALGAYARLRPDAAGGYVISDVQSWVRASSAPERRGTTIDEHPEASGNIVAWSKVSRTDFWRRTGLRFPEGRLYEDQIVAQQMYAAARRFDTVPDVVAHWRVRADGSSITQREAHLDVLLDCLEAMETGLRVLESSGHPLAAQARVGQLLRMDVPRLAQIARTHPDAAYRRALGAFTREVWARAGSARTALDAASATVVDAARLW